MPQTPLSTACPLFGLKPAKLRIFWRAESSLIIWYFSNKLISYLFMASFWWVALNMIFLVTSYDALRANCALGDGIKEALIWLSAQRTGWGVLVSAFSDVWCEATTSEALGAFITSLSCVGSMCLRGDELLSQILVSIKLDNFETSPSVSDWVDSVQKEEGSAETHTEHGT